ncbi:MAG: hypothetical protein R2701_00105 [Acidimicrobiales bacterium]
MGAAAVRVPRPGWAYDAHRRGLGAPHPVAEEAHHEPAEPDPTPVGAA